MNALGKILVALAGVGALSQANAIPVDFSFSGECSSACSFLGLNSGDSVKGGFATNEASLSDGFLLGDEIGSFWIDFGLFSLNDSNSSIATTFLTLNGEKSAFTNGLFRIDGIYGLFPGANFDFLAFEGDNTWQFVLPLVDDPSGNGSFTRATSVPEPGTLSLLGLGLLSAGFLGRRRRQSRLAGNVA
jgi:hypothetical protein